MHCSIACEIWTLIFCLLEISWAILNSVVDLLANWKGNLGKQASGEIFGSQYQRIKLPMFLIWTIWKEKNRPTLFHFLINPFKVQQCFFKYIILFAGLD